MSAAIRLGCRELGRTWPNPAVGALVVAGEGAERCIVGRGWTRAGGRPHAEVVALKEAGERARGATVYVSLEPCAHHGKTPPCAEALITAGVARVVSAMEDPNPKVGGQGHAALRAAGMEVVTGVEAEAAAGANGGHLMRVRKGRPWVTLKLAVSADGCIAGPERGPVAITGKAARARAHMLRARHDAILIGAGTALADDPELTCRLPGMAERSPVRVVLDSRLRLPTGAKLLRDADIVPSWLVTSEPETTAKARALSVAGARLITVAEGHGGRVDIGAALSRLAAAGLTRLLVEGGAEIAGALVAEDLVDEAVIFEADKPLGAGGLPAIAGTGLAAVTQSRAYTRRDVRAVGADRMVTYSRDR